MVRPLDVEPRMIRQTIEIVIPDDMPGEEAGRIAALLSERLDDLVRGVYEELGYDPPTLVSRT